ncbi:MAG: hypothetical protein GY705_11895 [Bacteroidetes bacterium]|nr:hypothetical protein [Bacteroidota bacterium]
MIYPQDIEEYVLSNDIFCNRFGKYLHPRAINVSKTPITQDSLFDKWIATIGWRQSTAVKRYHDYIIEMRDIFEDVRINMSYANPNSSHTSGDDELVAGWAGIGMMPIALYLYYLHSHGIRGAVLECGCFKGGSSVCLSWICHKLDLKLYVADSFEGLPYSDNSYYNKGSFSGSLEEVRSNIETFGKIKNVEFIKGFYSDSLKGFNQQLMLIWLDVDLKSSVLDAMEHAYPCLMENGVIFCDGLGEDRDFSGDKLLPASGESKGLVEYFKANDINYKAKYAGYGHMGLVIPNCQNKETILYQTEKDKVLLSNIVTPKKNRQELANQIKRINSLENQLEDRLSMIDAQQRRIEDLTNSTSWKITSPLRKVSAFFRSDRTGK